MDPGTDRVGVGIVEYHKNSFVYINSFVLPFPKNTDVGKNLFSLSCALKKTMKKFNPDFVGVERLFFSKNKKTALSVSEARGVILSVIAEFGVPTIEITPSKAKLFVAGNGGADKRIVAKMVGKFLKKDFSGRIDDETDALSIAIATAFLSK